MIHIDYIKEFHRILESDFDKTLLASVERETKVALYGAGKMGRMAVDLMSSVGLAPEYLVEKKQSGNLSGYDIHSLDQLSEHDKVNLLFVVSVVTVSYAEVARDLRAAGVVNVIHFYEYSERLFPEVMPNGWLLSSPTVEEQAKILDVFELLAHDRQSIYDYLRFLWWRLRRVDKSYLECPIVSKQRYFKASCMPKLKPFEVYVDAGAHLGSTINEFIDAVESNYDTIIAFEPDQRSFGVLKEKYKSQNKIMLYPYALIDSDGKIGFSMGLDYASRTSRDSQSEVNCVYLDSFLRNEKPSIIKLHIEGDELKALIGSLGIIKKNRPIVIVLADHSIDGLFRIPLFFKQFEDYKIFFNMHDFCGNTSIFYAIPKVR